MENDDKLKAFFKEHAQPLRREVWFSRRVMNRLPGETRRKIRIIEMTVWFISAIFGLSLCFMFGKSITDPCLGWEKSEKLIYDIADQL